MKLPSEMTLAKVALAVGGRLAGSPELTVSSLAMSPLNAAPGDIVFVFEPKLLNRLDECKARAVVVPEGTPARSERPMIFVQRPMLAFRSFLSAIEPRRYVPEFGVHPTAIVDPTAQLAADVAVGPLVVIGPGTKIGARTKIMAGTVIGGDVTIGEECIFYPGCVIADYVRVGNRVTLQQGASLGSDGFGYVTERPSNMELRMAGVKELSDKLNPLLKIPQIGTVIVEDDVEIGSNATIDRATVGATIIGRGTKIDNLVMIAHNCRLGQEVIVVSQTAVGGSCVVGDRVILSGHVGVKDHINIGKDAIVEGKAGVMKDIPEADVQMGAPSMPAREFFTQVAHIRRLPKIFDEFKALQKRVAHLEHQLKAYQTEAEAVREGGARVGSSNR